MASDTAPDADDAGGGSFWSTFGGPADAGEDASALETLLQSADCAIEALLDKEDIIQEFKACNDRLVARLCEPDAVKALFAFVTCEPPDYATDLRKFRYPFVSVELMSCASDAFFKVIVGDGHPELMGSLWAFLESTAPHDANPVLAGYFARTAALIFSKCPLEVAAYLRARGSETLLQRFLERLHLRSIAELFTRLLLVEEASHQVFPTDGLIVRILQQLQKNNVPPDMHENITLILAELLAQKGVYCSGGELCRQMTSEDVMGMLLDSVFSGSSGNASASTAILSNIVFHFAIRSSGPSGCGATPTLSPLSPPSMLVSDADAADMGLDESVVTEATQARSLASPPCSDVDAPRQACSSAWSEGSSAPLLQDVGARFPRLRVLLDGSLARNQVVTMPIGQINAVGPTTLELINLVFMLVRTGCPTILEALLREQLLPRCMELFFRHPWNTLLHNAIRLLLSEVLVSTDGVRPKLLEALLNEGGLAERLRSEYAAETASAQAGIRHRHARVGYMGHLHAMCCEIRDFCAKVPECGAVLAAGGWSEVVLPVVQKRERQHGEQLGGGIPDGDRHLASSGVVEMSFQTGSRPGDSTDFVLDDINDFDSDSTSDRTDADKEGACGLSLPDDDFHPEGGTEGQVAKGGDAFSVEPSEAGAAEAAPDPWATSGAGFAAWGEGAGAWASFDADAPAFGDAWESGVVPEHVAFDAPAAAECEREVEAPPRGQGARETPRAAPVPLEPPKSAEPEAGGQEAPLASARVPPETSPVAPAVCASQGATRSARGPGAGSERQASPEGPQGPQSLAADIGAENLFALIGDFGRTAVPAPAREGTVPPSGRGPWEAPAWPSPWASHGAWCGAQPAPLGALGAPRPPSFAPPDRSWVADFDPLFQAAGADPWALGSAPVPSAGAGAPRAAGQPECFGDLSLASLWPTPPGDALSGGRDGE